MEALLFEEFGAMSAGVEELLMRVAKVAGRKLTWWQYDQTSWSARYAARCLARVRARAASVAMAGARCRNL